MLQRWHSNGKIILTGEYLVLFGAKALATPLKAGQSLEVESSDGKGVLFFKTTVCDKEWFLAIFETATLEIIHTNRQASADYVQMVLRAAQKLNNRFLQYSKKYNATADLDFNPEWGFGSSSTLISNIAWWADVDPFQINRMVSSGSSYDIACARSESPVFYSYRHNTPVIEPITYKPECLNNMWLVYTGKKENTETNLNVELARLNPGCSEIEAISALSLAFSKTKNVKELYPIIWEHEKILSGLLKKDAVQMKMFKDFRGAIKSLGAWGGDFCLAVSDEAAAYVRHYFEQKGLTTVLAFNEWVI